MRDERPAEHTVPSCPVTLCPAGWEGCWQYHPGFVRDHCISQAKSEQPKGQINLNHTLGCECGYTLPGRLRREG